MIRFAAKVFLTTCTANLQAAVAAGFNVSLIYTVSRYNIEHLHEMVPLLASGG